MISLTFALDGYKWFVVGIENWRVGYRLLFPNLVPAILKVLVLVLELWKKFEIIWYLMELALPLIPMVDGLSLFPKKCIEFFLGYFNVSSWKYLMAMIRTSLYRRFFTNDEGFLKRFQCKYHMWM